MHRKKSNYTIILALSALLLGSVATSAHPGMEHVMGTVTSVAANSITVETVKHTRVTILIDQLTKFTNGDTQSSVKDLKVGDRIVIHAKRNADQKLIGAEVKWGTSSMPTGKIEDMDHKH